MGEAVPAREDRQSNRPTTGLGTPFQVDRDRILYSMPFRRLAGVTQVVSPGEGERARRLFEEHRDGGTIEPLERVRLVADTIASLTDKQALLIYQRMTGLSLSSMIEPVMR